MALSNLIVKISADTKEFVVGTTRVKRDAEGLKSGMKMLSQAITEGSVRLKEMAAAGKGASKEYQELKTQVSQARSALRGMGGELSTLKKTADSGFGGRQIADALTGGLIGGGVAGLAIEGANMLRTAFNETLKVTADFDDQLRKIGATSGASASEMLMLRDAAIEWGAKSAFSASESAQAMQYMAQAGWSAQQSIEGLPGVLNLAASSGEDLAMTASILTDGLTAFKMGASDSAKFADVLAAAAAASNTNVAKMGDTFRYVGPVAGALGFTIEDTALAIGLMANSGIKGEQAGTALRAMFTRLADPTKESKMAMDALGISLTDNEGRTKTLAVLIGELRAAFEGLTPAQQAQSAAQLAGTEAMSGALALITASEESLLGLSKAIDTSNGKAQEMADIMEGGVGGSLRRMQGAWESFQLTIAGDGGFARVWYDGWAAVFESWSNGVQAIKKDYQEFKRILEIGLFDALKESEQTAGIEAFGKAYKKALDGMPMDKLTDQMTRLTWTAEGQALAFEKRNAAVMANLAPRTDLAEAIKAGKAGKELNEATKASDRTNQSLGRTQQTAASVFGGAILEIQRMSEYYTLIGEDTEITAASHRILETAMKKAFDTGDAEAAEYVLKLKAMNDELKKGQVQKFAELPKIQGRTIQGVVSAQISSKIALPQNIGMGQTENQMRAEMQRIQEAMGNVAVGSEVWNLLNAQLDDYTAKMNTANAATEAFAGLQMQMGDAAYNAFQAVGSGAMSASEGVKAFGLAAVNASLDAARGALVEAIMNNAKFLTKTLGPLGIPIALAGAGALFGVLKGAIGRSKAVAFAEGGIVSGPVMGLVGEYAGASRNPEVIAPLDKLQSMLQGSGSTHVTGTFRVQGSDLVLALDNAQRKMSQFRV